jgi:hypothetical protein
LIDLCGSTLGGCTEAIGRTGLVIYDLRRTAIRDLVRSRLPEAGAIRISGHNPPSPGRQLSPTGRGRANLLKAEATQVG